METTGLVKTLKGCKPEEEYPNYKNLDEYINARIVSIGWLYMKDYDYNYEISIENINECLIKPEEFEIPEKATKIHGITTEEALEKGKNIKYVLKKIGKIIKECEYIIGYNIYYDINILLSELYRNKRHKTINKILSMKKEEKIICLGQISSKEARPENFYKYNLSLKIFNNIVKLLYPGIRSSPIKERDYKNKYDYNNLFDFLVVD